METLMIRQTDKIRSPDFSTWGCAWAFQQIEAEFPSDADTSPICCAASAMITAISTPSPSKVPVQPRRHRRSQARDHPYLQLDLADAVSSLKANHVGDSPQVTHLIDFIEKSQRGLTR